jgi:hypothetical protein
MPPVTQCYDSDTGSKTSESPDEFKVLDGLISGLSVTEIDILATLRMLKLYYSIVCPIN